MISRRTLYAHGLPFGESCTRREAGRIIYGGGGGGGDSSSSSSEATTTNNTDKRLVADTGSTGVTADQSKVDVITTTNTTTYNTSTDGGAVKQAIDLARDTGQTSLTGYKLLLDTTLKLASQMEGTLQSNVDLTSKLASTAQSAYADAATQSAGNKNLVYAGMAVVGLATIFAFKK